MTKVIIPPEIYEKLKAHLFSRDFEQVAFMYLRSDGDDLIVEDYFCVPPSELVYESEYHAEISADAQAMAIKSAWDKKLHLGEIHTHPFSVEGTTFSYSDAAGFREFVPHVWWRLKGGPYVAMVFGQGDFDALVWKQDSETPEMVEHVQVGDEALRPNNLFFKYE